MTTTAKKNEEKSDDHAHARTHTHTHIKNGTRDEVRESSGRTMNKKSTKILSYKPEDREEEVEDRRERERKKAKQTKDSAVPMETSYLKCLFVCLFVTERKKRMNVSLVEHTNLLIMLRLYLWLALWHKKCWM